MVIPKRPEEGVCCTRDKDLDGRAGLHYVWASGKQKERPLCMITEMEANRWFFRQLLTGDKTVDNILGLYNIGSKAQCVKDVMKMTDIGDMYKRVQHQYELRFGSYWKMFMHENARLLWMLRTPDDDIREWLDVLEEERQQKLSLEDTEF